MHQLNHVHCFRNLIGFVSQVSDSYCAKDNVTSKVTLLKDRK